MITNTTKILYLSAVAIACMILLNYFFVSGSTVVIARDVSEPSFHVDPSLPLLVACAIVKNNQAAVNEWVAFHSMQGFAHFFIYDDGSEPPLNVTILDLGNLRSRVTVIPWAHSAANWGTHRHAVRQMYAYRDCARKLHATDALTAMFDVDEYMWPCDPQVSIAQTVREGGAAASVLRCPRFGPLDQYDPTQPIVVQYTKRCPQQLLHENEIEVSRSIPACQLRTRDEGGPCFSSRPKNIYDMKRLPNRLVDWISIHDLDPRGEERNVTYTKTLLTNGSRRTGICCNHYFAKDMAEVRRKGSVNGNDFYERLANESSLRLFYSSINDFDAATRFGTSMGRFMNRRINPPLK